MNINIDETVVRATALTLNSLLGGYASSRSMAPATVISATESGDDSFLAEDNNWLLRLLVNLLGYATIIGPGALIICYVRRTKFLENQGGPLARVLRLFVLGHEPDVKPSLELGGGTEPPRPPSRSFLSEAFVLAYCFLGLQISYLTWGVLQEKIMTQKYYEEVLPSDGQRFGDSQFLVFVNRVLAFTLSGLYLLFTQQPRHLAPVYKYSYCSFSNIMSSWCQYEALKFVAFPTQVLAKASKVIPVMLMGRLVSRKSYDWHEYLLALGISVGMGLFLLSRSSGGSSSSPTSSSLSGLIILASYLVLDSFTSNWQSELFRTYRMSSAQMMCGVNFFSCLLTFVSLLQQGALAASLRFMFRFHAFFYDCLLLSICSATGQLFVFHTIAQFGPVVFVVAMTVRQAVAVLLSCLIYGHRLGALGIVGVLIVFGAVFAKIYLRQRAA
ncbi:adenosine 3'-phospho 5'-phosphosulfate transporter 1 [Dermacentor albipictus]|uniref:adenosine 3'-phospho 5'-phosphosulfate transporter 1 n=1 Tax=Dermacentor albipictus TaxID=60249 RepID=UPI0031FDEF50